MAKTCKTTKLRHLAHPFLLLFILSVCPGASASGDTDSARKSDPIHSPANPTATADQRDLEALALKVLQTPEVQFAKAQAANRLKVLIGKDVPEEAWQSFDNTMEEWAFGFALRAANSDSGHPRVLRHLFAPAHQWFGMAVPGNHGIGGDNPDNIYSIIPIDPYSRFEVIGHHHSASVDAPFQIVSNLSLSTTLSMLEWQDIKVRGDGSFVVSIDPEPANGRPNHLQTSPDALYLLIRDTMPAWGDVPNHYSVKRLDSPLAKPMSLEQITKRAALWIINEIPSAHYWQAMVNQLAENQFTPAFVTGKVGGMFTARMSYAKLHLRDDEAYVITVKNGRADYRGLVLMNFWQHSVDYGNRLTSMNDSQSDPNPDGTTTYVISKNDPGIYNWIDTTGLRHPKVMIRWQGLPYQDKQFDENSWVEGKLVKFNQLEKSLPKYVKKITPESRKKQLELRQQSYKTRFTDR